MGKHLVAIAGEALQACMVKGKALNLQESSGVAEDNSRHPPLGRLKYQEHLQDFQQNGELIDQCTLSGLLNVGLILTS